MKTDRKYMAITDCEPRKPRPDLTAEERERL
jgi:hypothetical protein